MVVLTNIILFHILGSFIEFVQPSLLSIISCTSSSSFRFISFTLRLSVFISVRYATPSFTNCSSVVFLFSPVFSMIRSICWASDRVVRKVNDSLLVTRVIFREEISNGDCSKLPSIITLCDANRRVSCELSNFFKSKTTL